MIVACDPGLTGAFALRVSDDTLQVVDMPTYIRMVGKAKRPTIDDEAVIELVRGFAVMGATHLVIEKVQGLPRQSAPAAFSFGYGYAVILTAARMSGLAVETVPPAQWKQAMRVPSDKKQSRARASDLLPAHKHLWPLAKHDGRAEAAMLALWGANTLAKRGGA